MVQIPTATARGEWNGTDSAESDGPVSVSADVHAAGAAATGGEKDVVAVVDDAADKSRFGNRMTLFALLALALILSLAAATFNYQGAVSATSGHEQADTGSSGAQDEIEMLKLDLTRLQQQAEDMQRERDAALEKARLEEELRARETQAAAEAALREKAAISAAERAAEQALKAKEQAEVLAEKQRLEKRRLRAAREKLERERRQAELEQQLLEEQQQNIELEQKRLAREKAKLETQALPEWGDSEP